MLCLRFTSLLKTLLIKEEDKMKYEKPSYELILLETEDIMSASGVQEGSITDGNTTIFGSETSFSEFFENLL